MSSQTTAQPPRRVRKRIYIPLLLLLLLIGFGAKVYVRGTVADDVEKNPASVAAGTVTQLLDAGNGSAVVRCAVLVDASPATVWQVVNGYDRHDQFLPYLSKVTATQAGNRKIRLDGIAHSRLWGDWPFHCLVLHTEAVDSQKYSASWNESDVGEFKLNRGSWDVSESHADASQSLLVFTLQIELKRYPNFIVRNIIMDRVGTVVRAMRDEAMKRKQA
jgi:hypothetical protein